VPKATHQQVAPRSSSVGPCSRLNTFGDDLDDVTFSGRPVQNMEDCSAFLHFGRLGRLGRPKNSIFATAGDVFVNRRGGTGAFAQCSSNIERMNNSSPPPPGRSKDAAQNNKDAAKQPASTTKPLRILRPAEDWDDTINSGWEPDLDYAPIHRELLSIVLKRKALLTEEIQLRLRKRIGMECVFQLGEIEWCLFQLEEAGYVRHFGYWTNISWCLA
jgi:hypothetical protein